MPLPWNHYIRKVFLNLKPTIAPLNLKKCVAVNLNLRHHTATLKIKIKISPYIVVFSDFTVPKFFVPGRLRNDWTITRAIFRENRHKWPIVLTYTWVVGNTDWARAAQARRWPQQTGSRGPRARSPPACETFHYVIIILNAKIHIVGISRGTSAILRKDNVLPAPSAWFYLWLDAVYGPLDDAINSHMIDITYMDFMEICLKWDLICFVGL